MKVKYAWIFQAIKNATQLEETPEHNALQNRFLNKDYCIKLGNYFFELNKKEFESDEQTQYIDYTLSGKTVKEEIKEELSEKLTTTILKQFGSLVPFFNVHGIDIQEGVNLEEYLTYFKSTKNDFGLTQNEDHVKNKNSWKMLLMKLKKISFQK